MKTIDPQNITTVMINELCRQCPAIEALPWREVKAALIAFLQAAPEVRRLNNAN